MRIVLDTDPGIDDALAILYLAAQEQAEIVAVGSVHGNVPAPQAADNALRVLELAGLHTVPVAIGARRPLAQPLHTAEFVHGHDGLGGHAGPPPEGRPIKQSAAEQLVRLARQHPGELTLLALGPLTNIALALLLEPELPGLLRSVIVMGGALTAPGNITPSADANSWHDPEATDLVLGAAFPLTLIGLEVTEAARVDQTWLDTLATIDNPRARFATSIIGHYANFYAAMFGRRECTLHDPLAAAIALDPDLATYRRLAVAVELTGTHTRGRLIADLRPIVNTTHIESSITTDRHPVDVALTADAATFLSRLLEALS
ncbi:purine nucleosidase [Saccharothrix carnea]|uniref:Purine nucleosidase n=1 Tax=Saccharothrix carnea TaxID=1280637 RepID=A0A2P8HYY4_SACCR|nr:nucleoside hydrolase [Saccharothrix carnea]PSL51403.1 purine nucleosidase [Saccharothrix carnea]